MPRLSRLAPLAALAVLAAVPLATSPVAAQEGFPPIHSVELNPRLPTDADDVTVLVHSGTGPGCTYLDFPEQAEADPAGATPRPVRILAPVEAIQVTCPGWDFQHEVRLGNLDAGSYVLQIFSADFAIGTPIQTLIHEQHFVVTSSREQVSLHNGQLVVEAEWIGGPAAGEPLHAVTLGKDAGYFWSFGSTNVELTVKILDGGLVNGKYWVFLAPMTSLGLEVTVYDARGCTVPACPSKVYVLAPGKPDTLFDLDHFPSSLP